MSRIKLLFRPKNVIFLFRKNLFSHIRWWQGETSDGCIWAHALSYLNLFSSLFSILWWEILILLLIHSAGLHMNHCHLWGEQLVSCLSIENLVGPFAFCSSASISCEEQDDESSWKRKEELRVFLMVTVSWSHFPFSSCGAGHPLVSKNQFTIMMHCNVHICEQSVIIGSYDICLDLKLKVMSLSTSVYSHCHCHHDYDSLIT